VNVTIVIVTYNSAEHIVRCLESIRNQTTGVSYEVVVADNASTDGTVRLIKDSYPSVRVIENRVNVGFGGAANIGAANSDAEYVFFLNPDATLINNVVAILFHFMESNAGAHLFAVGGSVLDADGRAGQCAGNFPSVLGFVIYLFRIDILLPRRILRMLATAYACDSDMPFFVDYVSGAAMFVRRNCLRLNGGFDEAFFMYFEETELSLRQSVAGFSSMIVPDAIVAHIGGASSSGSAERRVRMYEEGKRVYIRKAFGKTARSVAIWAHRAAYLMRLVITWRRIDLVKCGVFWKP
jgi:GT2 family glycosyltransferase